MEELIKDMASKIGVSEEQAQDSIGMVMEFIKTKLPENLHSMLDSISSGQDAEAGGVADLAKQALGGVFGGKS